MKEEINRGLASLDTLWKDNNGKVSGLTFTAPLQLHCQTSCKESIVSSLFNRAYCIITNKEDFAKENARKKEVMKEKGYQKSTISKLFKRSANNHS